jgi:hypothetical protein
MRRRSVWSSIVIQPPLSIPLLIFGEIIYNPRSTYQLISGPKQPSYGLNFGASAVVGLWPV